MPHRKLERSHRLTRKDINAIIRRNKIKKIQKKLTKLLFKKDKS